MSSEETRNRLEAMVNDLADKITSLKPNTPEHTAACKEYVELWRVLNETDKVEIEMEKINTQRDLDDEKLKASVENDLKKDSSATFRTIVESVAKVGVGALTFASAVLSYKAYDRWQDKSLAFEQDHIYKSQTVKDLRGSSVIRR